MASIVPNLLGWARGQDLVVIAAPGNADEGDEGMATTYEADIRPLFRDRDLACMVPHGILLDLASWMCDAAGRYGFDDHGNARIVQKRLVAGEMPPDAPWSPAQLTAYEAWVTDGFQP
jgi:hypothetical protein